MIPFDTAARPRVLVVVAHPDDEVLGCGALLARLQDVPSPNVTVVHVTDGAPRDAADARRLGFIDNVAYAATRRDEAEAALALAGFSPRQLFGLGLPDQGAADDLAALARQLRPFLARAEIVLTHAFEGGHPDHDAVAFAVRAASDRISARGGAPPRIVEMPFYHAASEGWARQVFRPDRDAPETVLQLSDDERRLKARMIAAHRSQADTLASFDLTAERFRSAPRHDFLALPDALLYERHDWNMTRARWIERVSAARAEMGGRDPVEADRAERKLSPR